MDYKNTVVDTKTMTGTKDLKIFYIATAAANSMASKIPCKEVGLIDQRILYYTVYAQYHYQSIS